VSPTEIREHINSKNELMGLSFNAEAHEYHQGTKRLSGITQLVGKQFPFDRDFIAAIVAEKRGVSVEEVLLEWTDKAGFGSLVHDRLEYLTENQWISPVYDSIMPGLFLGVRPILNKFTIIAAEIQIAFPELGLSTCIDFLGINDKGEVITINYKTSKNMDDRSFGGKKGVSFFSEFTASNFSKLMLQSQIERAILMKVYGVDVKHIYGLHIPIEKVDKAHLKNIDGSKYEGQPYRLIQAKRGKKEFKAKLIEVPIEKGQNETFELLRSLK